MNAACMQLGFETSIQTGLGKSNNTSYSYQTSSRYDLIGRLESSVRDIQIAIWARSNASLVIMKQQIHQNAHVLITTETIYLRLLSWILADSFYSIIDTLDFSSDSKFSAYTLNIGPRNQYLPPYRGK